MTRPSSKPKSPHAARRDSRRGGPMRERRRWSWFDRPEVFAGSLILLMFIGLASAAVIWTRGQPMVSEGQIMRDTLAARVEFQVVDDSQTRLNREQARLAAPRHYVESETTVTALRRALLGLPRAVAGKSIDEISPELVSAFDLNVVAVEALGRYVDEEGEPTPEWGCIVERFVETGLYARPIISSERWQEEQTRMTPVRIIQADGRRRAVPFTSLVEHRADWSTSVQEALVAEFGRELRPHVLARLRALEPTFRFDERLSQEAAEQAAATVPRVVANYHQGFILYTRGDRLTADDIALIRAEQETYAEQATVVERWVRRAGVIGLVALVTFALAGYLTIFYPKMLRHPKHLLALSLLSAGALAVSAATTVALPQTVVFAMVAPTVLLGIIIMVAYDSRLAIGLTTFHALLVSITLDQRISALILMVVGVAVAVTMLREIRDRNSLVQAGAVTGVVVGLGGMLMAMWSLPMGEEIWIFWRTVLINGLGGAAAGLLVGFFSLGILSTVERLFDVTTGLTLVELRDPKHPLLRRLQERAIGTWNHSLQVANIAEAAADEIGANSLLAYVGSLYHDIGKMNKPQYFVENQSEGFNRHEKLSPAMSLLLIVGHVKDGVEMAREWGLPRPLHHFVEAHHGTTLVEYFYHVAKERAEAGMTHDGVSEVEYRYPGPKPRTKECAIVMLADACESASRTLADPTPARIEQLVHSLARKRLLDHQFDECNLTLRELTLIENSIIKSINAIRHARVVYPEKPREAPHHPEVEPAPSPLPAQTA